MNKNQNEMIEEVINEILQSETEPNYQALQKWITNYPEFREEISDFFATWAVQNELPRSSKIDENRIANHMVSYAMNLIHQNDLAMERLGDAIKASGQSEDEVAAKSKLDFSIVAKLDRRLIRFDSIPQLCISLIAEATCQPPELISSLLKGGPVQLKPTFKSKKKPVSKTEDFSDAVKTSLLSDEVKNEWLQVVSDECEARANK